ncbi:MAG: hypothetical protein E7345_02950 [Clostridiales bacterium]|nr:hypothetical protein [Clostridiales bacterium]
MKNIYKKIMRNKIFYVFLIIIVIMFPSTLYNESDKDRTLVVTSIGIDKEDNDYKLTVLAVIPKGSEDISANLEIFTSKGETIAEALDQASANTGKEVGLAHCDSIVLSQDILNDNISIILDYFIRTSNLATNASLIISENSAEELIKATKSSNNYLDLSLKSIVMHDEKSSMLNNTTIESFYKTYFSKSGTFCLPLLTTEQPEKQSSEQSGGQESGQAGSSSGSNESGSGESGGGKIKNNQKVVLLKQGKKVRELNEDEKFIYNLISPTSENIKIKIENINDNYVTNSTEVYQQIKKFVLPIYKFRDGKPIVTYHIWLSLMIDEISSDSNYSFASIDGLQSFLSDIAKEKINMQVNEKLESTLKTMKENNEDILGFYDKFNAFTHNKWEKYLTEIDNPDNYLENLNIEIKLYLNYVI